MLLLYKVVSHLLPWIICIDRNPFAHFSSLTAELGVWVLPGVPFPAWKEAQEATPFAHNFPGVLKCLISSSSTSVEQQWERVILVDTGSALPDRRGVYSQFYFQQFMGLGSMCCVLFPFICSLPLLGLCSVCRERKGTSHRFPPWIFQIFPAQVFCLLPGFLLHRFWSLMPNTKLCSGHSLPTKGFGWTSSRNSIPTPTLWLQLKFTCVLQSFRGQVFKSCRFGLVFISLQNRARILPTARPVCLKADGISST